MDYRKPFFKKMCELAEKDKDVILLVGDLGYSFMEEYAEKYPDQFINMGIAEQNMIGVACGLALAGKKPFVYSGACFLLFRPYEQVRDDVCYNDLPVRLVATGASQFLGFSHNLAWNEDIQVLHNLPNLTINVAENEGHFNKIMDEMYKDEHPSYTKL